MFSNALVAFATAALLGPRGRGELAAMLAVGTLVGIGAFGSLHIGVAHAFRQGSPASLRTGAKGTSAISTALCATGVVASSLGEAGTIGTLPASQLGLALVGSGFVVGNLFVLRTVQALGANRLFRNAWVLQSVGFAGIGIPTAMMCRDASSVAVVWIATQAAPVLLAVPTFRRLARTQQQRPMSAGSVLKLSLAAHVATFGQQLLFRGDLVLLGFLVSAKSMGVYSIASPLASLTWGITEALSLLAASSYRKQTLAETVTRQEHLVKLNLVLSFAAAWPVVGAAVLVGKYMTGYEAVPYLVLILIPGSIIQGVGRIGVSGLQLLGQSRILWRMGIVCGALALLYVPCIVLYGTWGAATASTAIYFAQALIVFRVWRDLERRHARTRSGRDSVRMTHADG